MNTIALLGILSILYAVVVAWIALAKPVKLWDMAKVRMFRKLLGEKGTMTLFLVLAAAFLALGIWLVAR